MSRDSTVSRHQFIDIKNDGDLKLTTEIIINESLQLFFNHNIHYVWPHTTIVWPFFVYSQMAMFQAKK